MLKCAAAAQKNILISPEGITLGRSCGRFGTKIYLVTDGSDLRLNIVLRAGVAHKRQFALRLLDGISYSAPERQYEVSQWRGAC